MPSRARTAVLAASEVEQSLSRSESLLLLGAFLTLAASLASFATL